MSETPLPNSPNSNPDPGWQQVAQEMHTYHPALREHAARNLAERGIEISPEHQAHVDTARPVVPNVITETIDPTQFDGPLIGELTNGGLGYGHEALANKDLSLQQRFELAVDEIKTGSTPEQTYTLEAAEQEKPFYALHKPR